MFSELEDEIRIRLQDRKDELQQELINEIDPEIPTKYNSVNVFLGRAGSGKSFNILQIFAKISQVCPRTHLIIYINKTGEPNDRTYSEIFKDLIKIPIICCSYNEAVSTFDNIRRYKELYQQIKDTTSLRCIVSGGVKDRNDVLEAYRQGYEGDCSRICEQTLKIRCA